MHTFILLLSLFTLLQTGYTVVLPPSDEPVEYNSNYILYWNSVGLQLNQLTHGTLQGPQIGPPLSSRALGILHLAMHDAYFAIMPDPARSFTTYLTPKPVNSTDTRNSASLPPLQGATDPRLAVAGAAITVLEELYSTLDPTIAFDTTDQLSQSLQNSVDAFPALDTLSLSYRFGVSVGIAILDALEIRNDDPAANQDSFRVMPGRYRFDDDPTNPVRIQPIDPNDPKGATRAVKIYLAPHYGSLAKRLGVQTDDHRIGDPPVGFGNNDTAEYSDAVRDVVRMGGQPASNPTKRLPDQTAAGFFWAYDNSNLIGSPPRHYNQNLRQIAWDRRRDNGTTETSNAEFARLFALANVAMADAGIFAWREKYFFQFWRPLSGVREDGGPLGDPFFLACGAPDTNTNNVQFKPPFPSYPSGHATFGGAFFQIIRLYYRQRDPSQNTYAPDEPDTISFDGKSDELNGISRDLREAYDPSLPLTAQLGTVRTRVVRRFPSLWAAMFENAVSRVFLGVHWRFDAFASRDALIASSNSSSPPYQVNPDGTSAYKNAADVRYTTTGPRQDRPGQYPLGGVPLGIGIANDIFNSGLRQTPPEFQPKGYDDSSSVTVQPSLRGGVAIP